MKATSSNTAEADMNAPYKVIPAVLSVRNTVMQFREHCRENNRPSCISCEPVTVTVLDKGIYFASCSASVYMDEKLIARDSAGAFLTGTCTDEETQKLRDHAIANALALAGFPGSERNEKTMSEEKPKERKEKDPQSIPLSENEENRKPDITRIIRSAQEQVSTYSFDRLMDTVIPVGKFKGSTLRKVMATATAQNEEDVFTALSVFATKQFDVSCPADETTLEERIMFKTVMIRARKVIDSFRNETQMTVLDSKVPIGEFKGLSIRQMLEHYPEGLKAMEYYSGREFDERKAMKENPDIIPSDILRFKIRMFRINGFFTVEDDDQGGGEDVRQISVDK